MVTREYTVTVHGAGEKRIKAGVKLACKTDFIRFSTSGERTMLLVRRKPDKKMLPSGERRRRFQLGICCSAENVTKLLKAIAFLF